MSSLAYFQTLIDRLAPSPPTGPPAPQKGRFFDDPAIEAAIDRIVADPRDLTFVVGAGVSMEAGLPSWPLLVRRLLAWAAVRRIPAEDRAEWVTTIEEDGLTAAAAVAEALAVDDSAWSYDLRHCLYEPGGEKSYHPGQLALQIAWAKQRLDSKLRLVTLNYDPLLERALEQLGMKPAGYVKNEAEKPGRPAVYHLHGLLQAGRPTGTLVLSERDYARVQTPNAFAESAMRRHLDENLCVFVGLSLTDANLIRWLYRWAAATAPADADAKGHVALFVRQATSNFQPALRTQLELAASSRWKQVHLQPLWTNYYAELAQFVHEVALRRKKPTAARFAARAQHALDAGKAKVVPAHGFDQAQQDSSDILRGLVTKLRKAFAKQGRVVDERQIGIGLWAVDHAEGTVTLWVASDRLHRTPDALNPRSLTLSSDFAAVEAVTRGAAVVLDLSGQPSRWDFVRGIPLISEPKPGGRLIVGALTVTASSASGDELGQADAQLWHEVDGQLQKAALRLFA